MEAGGSQEIVDPGKRSRAESGIPIIPALDGFRALGVIGIVFTHILLFSGAVIRLDGTTLGDALIILPLGVDLLFVVSGFVVFLPTVVAGGDFGNVKAYAIRRVARLLPAAWVLIAIVFVLLAVAPPPESVFLESGPSFPLPGPLAFLGHLAFLQTPIEFFDTGFPRGLGIAGPLWTLSLEMIFYAVLPLIAAAWYRRPWIGLAISAVVSIAWHVGFDHLGAVAGAVGLDLGADQIFKLKLASDYQFPAYAFCFGAGMSAAWAYMRLRARYPADVLGRRAAQAQPAALVAVALFTYLATRYGLPGGLPVGAPAIGRNSPLIAIGFSAALAALMVATSLAPWPRQWLVSNRLSRWTADVSYGIYLIHYPALAYILVVLSPPQTGSLSAFALWTALTLSASFSYAYLSARFIERPIRRWAHRYGRRSTATMPAVREAG